MKARFRTDIDLMNHTTRLCVACALVVFAGGLASPALAQVPYVAIYFDDDPFTTRAWCPSEPALDTLTVYVHGLNTLIIAAEFSIELPPELAYIESFSSATLALGDPVLAVGGAWAPGVSYGWSRPQEAFEPLLLTSLVVYWMCDRCGSASLVWVKPHQMTGYISFASWPDLQAITYVYGFYAVICPFTPVETSSWGAIKAL